MARRPRAGLYGGVERVKLRLEALPARLMEAVRRQRENALRDGERIKQPIHRRMIL